MDIDVKVELMDLFDLLVNMEILIDPAGKSIQQCYQEFLKKLNRANITMLIKDILRTETFNII